MQKILTRHNLGLRAQRVAALAQITAVSTGLVTDAAKDGPFGFCHFAARPGDRVALDTFYVGKLKGVGAVYQLTAIDTTTRWAVCRLVAGDKTAVEAARFVDHVTTVLATLGVPLRRVLSDIHYEWVTGIPPLAGRRREDFGVRRPPDVTAFRSKPTWLDFLPVDGGLGRGSRHREHALLGTW